ncbi:MAG: response regulator [Bryobacterales bacterium]|nr:response regulator [Bryobacterales bacterium]
MPSILLAEDNELNRNMLSRRLELRGFSVILATNGLEAVRMAEDSLPAIILMDMSLPEIDGWEATRRLKNNPRTAHIPVLALTAHAMPDDRHKALAAGCDDYDAKPVNFPQLLDKIGALLARRTDKSNSGTESV